MIVAKVYALQVVNGKRELAQVPERWRDECAQVLAEMGWEER